MFTRDSLREWPIIAAGTFVVGAGTVYGATKTDYTAPILTFAGVLLVALITAFTATRAREAESQRQRERLDAESHRQRDAIAGERDRLRLQLAHERAMTDLELLRALLDEAAVNLHEVDHTLTSLVVLRSRRGAATGDEPAPEIVRSLTLTKDLDRLKERLAVRLGRNHDAVKALNAAQYSLLQTMQAVDRAPNSAQEELEEALSNAGARFLDARAEFLDAASNTAGVQIPDAAPLD
ncbi:hypothetical protein [Solirubrobacter soli]|uniref:hypothetical protein n=1 Tax=Solirubrobacter soli TaxID=363832 RepID=UPI000411A4A6|nr:hypothetical protein [Solirubrobacter soli]